MTTDGLGPTIRPRHLRTTAALRRMVAETSVRPGQLVLPLFVREGLREPQPVSYTHLTLPTILRV